MRWVFYSLLFLFIALVSIVVLAPLSAVMNVAAKSAPAINYTTANGSVWNGSVMGLRYGAQPVGNVQLKTDWLSVFGGALKSSVAVTDGGVLAAGDARIGLDGGINLSNIKVRGNTSDLLSLKQDIRMLGGDFSLSLKKLTLKSGACRKAESGEVWTNILTRFEQKYDWKGPELKGPITCENGRIVVNMTGTGERGETVSAYLAFDLNANGTFRAEIEKASEKVAQAATVLGFVTLGDKLVYEHSVRRTGGGANP